MLSGRLHRLAAIAAVAACAGLSARPAAAQSPRAERVPAGQAEPIVQGGRAVINIEAPDAERTREELMNLLQKYPPALGRVLKLDPSLLTNDAYLTPYPALAAFLRQHPEIDRNPPYFLERIQVGGGYVQDQASQSFRMWQSVMDWFGGLTVAGMILATLTWLIRLLVDYRRWYRLSKVQAEAHTKLLDRMTANEELLTYLQSPAGSRFLQSAPITLDPASRTIGAPFGRILWSVQAGLVLAAGGFGLQYVSGRVNNDAAQPILAMGILAVALGIGFVLSAVVSYAMSRRLGLIEAVQATKPQAGEL
jgi:hypothetical protein